jgi:hypothetical protein
MSAISAMPTSRHKGRMAVSLRFTWQRTNGDQGEMARTISPGCSSPSAKLTRQAVNYIIRVASETDGSTTSADALNGRNAARSAYLV